MTSVSGAKCEIIIPSRCFPFDYRERNIAEFFVCHSRPERCLPTCKGKTLFSRDPSCAHNAERRFCSLEKIGRLQVRCSHTHQIKIVTPSALGCEDCLRMGSPWVHLRLCRSCGHVGCCDQSPNRHAPGGTLKRPVIRLLRATTLPRAGAGATSTTSKSIWQTRRRTTVQFRASSE
jgi:hypothetical protein